MYATAHRLVSPRTGQEGVNAFLHTHGTHISWPSDPWNLPETNPGLQVKQRIVLQPGGNRVRSYLVLLAPDDASDVEIDMALTGLWLELIADEAGPPSPQGPMPNPLVYQRGCVVVRFGVEPAMLAGRVLEFAELRKFVDPSTATWDETSPTRASV